MHQRSFLETFRAILSSRSIPRYTGIAVSIFGGLVILAWHAHWRLVLQMLPNTAPMQYNTALCFIFSGIGLFLLTTRWAVAARLTAVIVALFTLLTLLQYLTGHSFGIDQLLFRPFFQADTAYPGRMAPLTAVCFILIGIATLLLAFDQKSPRCSTLAGVLACSVGVIVSMALFGYVVGLESAYGWGSYSRMAINTTMVFLALAVSLLSHILQRARESRPNFLRWLPVTASITLMAMIAFISALNMAELKSAAFWRQHTIEVILRTHAFEENLIDIQRGMRGYVTLRRVLRYFV